MTAASKREALALLVQAQEELYDADQILGLVRTNRQSAGQLSEWLDKLARVDDLITDALDKLA